MRIKVEYTDGTNDIVPITLLDQAKAEEYATTEEWGNAQQSPIRFMAYACYWHLRHTGSIAESFENWLAKVTTADISNEDPKAKQPDGTQTQQDI